MHPLRTTKYKSKKAKRKEAQQLPSVTELLPFWLLL